MPNYFNDLHIGTHAHAGLNTKCDWNIFFFFLPSEKVYTLSTLHHHVDEDSEGKYVC